MAGNGKTPVQSRPSTSEVLSALRIIAADMRRSTDVLEALLVILERENDDGDSGRPGQQ